MDDGDDGNEPNADETSNDVIPKQGTNSYDVLPDNTSRRRNLNVEQLEIPKRKTGFHPRALNPAADVLMKRNNQRSRVYAAAFR